MAVTVGTDSYGDETGLNAYADAREIELSGDETVLLLKAMDWFEIQLYFSIKYSESQALQFPRLETRYGDTSGEVPANIIKAQYVAAVLIDTGNNLNPVQARLTKREKVDIVEIEYLDGSVAATYPELEALLRNYLVTKSGLAVVTRR